MAVLTIPSIPQIGRIAADNKRRLAGETMNAAYFALADDSAELPFVIKLEGPQLIQHARDVLSGKETHAVRVSGTIAPCRATYNPHWSYHLEPSTIHFFELAMEVCDASIAWVEDNVSEIGGSALPNNFWCPWSARLEREVQPAGT